VGKPVAFQFVENAKILVQTKLSASQTRRWKLMSGAPPAGIGSDISMKEFDQDGRHMLQITNGLTGIRVPLSPDPLSKARKPLLDLENYGQEAPRVYLPAKVILNQL
jgi:hypothetical protein